MYDRILVPLDGSEVAEQVLPYVKLLAGPGQVPITLLRIVEPVPYDLIAVAERIPTDQVNSNLQANAQDYLEKTAASLREKGLPVVPKVLSGNAVSCIIEEGAREPGTLIAMSTHGRSGVARWAFGSVADKVIQTSTVPLLIVRAQEEPTPESQITLDKVIVPLDGSDLAEQILPHVADVAKSLNLSVILLRVTPTAGDYYRFMEYPVPELDDLPEQMDAEALNYLQEQSKRLRQQGVSKVEERLSHGPAAIEVAEFAKETPNNLVAMTTHGRSGVGRWILGSVADRVIRHSGDPVLVVRATE
jgi:nucleotide-binding universal stress UspA family protein